jgi:predicted nucleic acid-binding protein
VRVALDTNILAYAEGLGNAARCCAAKELIGQPPGHNGRACAGLTTKAKRSPAETRAAVLAWANSYAVADSTWPSLVAALDLTVDHQIPVWDALILAVAAENRCPCLLSEDFQHGFIWRNITVINPFIASKLKDVPASDN